MYLDLGSLEKLVEMWDHLFYAAVILEPPYVLGIIPMTKFVIDTDNTRTT